MPKFAPHVCAKDNVVNVVAAMIAQAKVVCLDHQGHKSAVGFRVIGDLAGALRDAERLIAVALSGDPPAEIAEELRDLLEQVYFGSKKVGGGLQPLDCLPGLLWRGEG